MTSTDTIPVPEQLRRPHPFVAATRDAAIGLRPGDDGRLRLGPEAGVFQIVVSRPLLRRTLRILQAVCAESERRGWEMQALRDTRYHRRLGAAIVIRGHTYPVEVREQTTPIPFTEGEIEEWRLRRWSGDKSESPPPQLRRRRPNGRLELLLPGSTRGQRAKWADGQRGLIEDKLGSMFPVLEARAEADELRAQELARRHEEFERQQARLRAERARIERLEREAEAWQRAERARGYLGALRDRLTSLQPADRERLGTWCDWIEAWIERTDPTSDPSQIVGLDDPKNQLRVPGR